MSLPPSVLLDRWSLLRLLRVLLPVALLALVGAGLAHLHLSAWGQARAWNDVALSEAGVAATLAEVRKYQLGSMGEVPAHAGALWHLLLWVGGGVWGDVNAVAAILSLCLTIASLIACSRLARDLFSGNIFVWGALLALAVSPAFLDSLSGQSSAALLLFLMLMAVKRHLDGLRGKAPILSPIVALYAGLAGLADPGAILLYPMLVLHALIATPKSERETLGRPVILVRGLIGVMTLLLILWPVVDLNLRIFRSPLPAPPLPGWDFPAWVGWLGAGRMQIIPLLLALLALVAGRLRTLRDPFVSLLPLLLAGALLVDPVSRRLGWQGGAPFRTLLEPMALLAFAWCLLAVLRSFGRDADARRNASMAVAAVTVLLSVALCIRIQAASVRFAAEQTTALRQALSAEPPDPARVIATDLPGWFYHEGYRKILDLTGRSCADILRCVDPDRQFAREELLQYFRAQQPALLILASHDLAWIQPMLVKDLGSANVTTSVTPCGHGHLQLVRLKWSP
jgi:hypothetical protein